MKLPNGHRAIVDLAKLRDYALNLEHPRGRHKARVFASALGLDARDAERLQGVLLFAAQTEEAEPTHVDGYGQRYGLDLTIDGLRGPVLVRSSWIVRQGEDFPRLTSCYVVRTRAGSR